MKAATISYPVAVPALPIRARWDTGWRLLAVCVVALIGEGAALLGLTWTLGLLK